MFAAPRPVCKCLGANGARPFLISRRFFAENCEAKLPSAATSCQKAWRNCLKLVNSRPRNDLVICPGICPPPLISQSHGYHRLSQPVRRSRWKPVQLILLFYPAYRHASVRPSSYHGPELHFRSVACYGKRGGEMIIRGRSRAGRVFAART
jgi:hypothetical protein